MAFPRATYPGAAVDILFIGIIVAFVALSLALVAGCAALERKK
jgi:hypothetical protein